MGDTNYQVMDYLGNSISIVTTARNNSAHIRHGHASWSTGVTQRLDSLLEGYAIRLK